MAEFTKHTVESAPEAAKPLLQMTEQKFGAVPNLIAYMAESPQAAEGYLTLSGLYDKTSFTPVERQVVLLATSYFNNCDYCMAAHSMLAGQSGMDDNVLEALRAGQPLPDEKLEALRKFTVRMVEARGWVDDSEVQAFLDAGYTQQNVLEVILGVAMKTISNYTNHIVETPLDSFLEQTAWEKPAHA